MAGLTPMVFAMVMQIRPMVAAVPNEVPIKKDRRQFSRKVRKIIRDGRIRPDAS
jgi:hypothetical protein